MLRKQLNKLKKDTEYEIFKKLYIYNNLEIVTPLLKLKLNLVSQFISWFQKKKNKKIDILKFSYHFDNCDFFYNPNFSNYYNNNYVKRDVTASLIS